MVNRKDILYYCGFVLAILSTFFHVLGLSTPHWLESYEQVETSFDRLGLWTACFHNYAYDMDYMGKTYDGCHWIYSYEYKPVFNWLNPAWLVLVQVLMVMALVINTCILFLMSVQSFIARLVVKTKFASVFINSMCMFLSAILIGFSVSLFGLQARVSRQWLPRPDQNYLSWSYGLTVVGAFFSIFSAMCLLTDALRLRFEERDKLRKGISTNEVREAAMPLTKSNVERAAALPQLDHNPEKRNMHMY